MEGRETSSVFGFALLIGGSAVGAGILGLPIQAGLAGFWPALLGMLLLWSACLLTAWVIADAYLRGGDPDADLASIFQRQLGTWGKWLVLTGYMINYYGILVAYLAGAGAVLNSLLGLAPDSKTCLLVFFVVATGACLFGQSILLRLNGLMMALLLISLGIFLGFAFFHVESANLAHVDWGYLPATLPVITCSLVYHNLVPLACRSLGGHRRRIFTALLSGSLIALIVGLLCLAAVVGALPLDGGEASLVGAFAKDQPAAVPLAHIITSPWFVMAGLVFSLLAVFTSYLGVGAGLMAFWGDLAKDFLANRPSWVRPLIVFGPSLAVVLIWPDLFLSALNLVGGLGLGLLVGLGPALTLLLRRPRGWPMAGALGLGLLVLFGSIVFIEMAQEAGLTHIAPNVEHWTSYQPK